MAIATTNDYNDTGATIIRDALLHLRVIDPDEPIPAEIGDLMVRQLNRMIKSWQAYGINLWKKGIGTLFLEKNTSEYSIPSTSVVGCYATTDEYKYTYTSEARSAGSDRIFVASISGLTVGGYIGVVLDNDIRFFAKILAVFGGTGRVDIDPVLPYSVSADIKAVYFLNRITNVYDILSINRITVCDPGNCIETPLSQVSYQDFFELPDKNSKSVPTVYNYNKYLDKTTINLWPVPSDYSNDLRFTYESFILDIDNLSNNPDFLQEWLDAIVLNLAVRSASYFGKNVGESYANLKAEAQNMFDIVNNKDNEKGSLYIQPLNW